MGRHHVAALAALALVSACRSTPSARPVGKTVSLTQPLGLPPLAIPAGNPPTAETIALGKKLFFSPLLSKDRSLACASCHAPQAAFSDPRRFSAGVAGKLGARNAPPVVNAAYYDLQFWDGRAHGLEEQASGPMMNPVEMAESPATLVAKCGSDPELRALFTAAYGSPEASVERIANALASYERTLVSGNSAFDRYQYGGDPQALSASARRGLDLFRTHCATCHTMQENFALFTDGKFHNLGVGMSAEGELTDRGKERGAFRTPGLRNVALTAPYMHDGSLKTLKEVVDFYVGGGNANPDRDPLIQPLTQLTAADRAALVAFLESLTGEQPK